LNFLLMLALFLCFLLLLFSLLFRICQRQTGQNGENPMMKLATLHDDDDNDVCFLLIFVVVYFCASWALQLSLPQMASSNKKCVVQVAAPMQFLCRLLSRFLCTSEIIDSSTRLFFVGCTPSAKLANTRRQ